jgi:hypothetical protein
LLQFLRNQADDGTVSQEEANSLAQLLGSRADDSGDLDELAAIIESLEPENNDSFVEWAKNGPIDSLLATPHIREALFPTLDNSVDAKESIAVRQTLLRLANATSLGLLDDYLQGNLPAEVKTFLRQAKEHLQGDAMQE